MRIFLNVIGVLCLPLGAVWGLQGLNILKSSVMSGHRRWLVIGAAVFVVGLLLLILNNRRKPQVASQ